MRGEIIGVWPETWREIWEPLATQESAPPDLFCELYRELSAALKTKPSVETLADIIDDPERSLIEFQQISSTDIVGEKSLINFFENTYESLDDLAGDALTNPYFGLLAVFIEKFNLRYDLCRPCLLCPTLPGVFLSLISDLRTITSRDTHLNKLMNDFEDAIRKLRTDYSEGHIKTCIQKQTNLLEGIGQSCPGVTETELGGICNQLNIWPHLAIRASLKNLYGFASNYPGIRHAGKPKNAIHNLEMRDMVAMSLVLAGFTPYLTDQLNAEDIYRGK